MTSCHKDFTSNLIYVHIYNYMYNSTSRHILALGGLQYVNCDLEPVREKYLLT